MIDFEKILSAAIEEGISSEDLAKAFTAALNKSKVKEEKSRKQQLQEKERLDYITNAKLITQKALDSGAIINYDHAAGIATVAYAQAHLDATKKDLVDAFEFFKAAIPELAKLYLNVGKLEKKVEKIWPGKRVDDDVIREFLAGFEF